MDSLLCLNDCEIISVSPTDEGITIAARTLRNHACCPDCREPSCRSYGSYIRHPQDLPISGVAVRLELQVLRFRCLNAGCPRYTFSCAPTDLLAAHARRTARLSQTQGRVGAVLGGEAGARLLADLQMTTSAATVLRLLRRQPLAFGATPRVLGVDDFAFRRGCTYGTILVDLEQHNVVDVLAERTSESLAKWLQAHPGVEIVARDRSTEYARGVREGAPKAVQVADRWHLLLNLKQVLERWLGRIHARLRRLPAVAEGYLRPSREGPFYRGRAAEAASLDSRTRRLLRYEEVKELHGAGRSLSAIARETGLNRKTVCKYVYAESFPERSRKPWFSAIDPYLGYLEARHAEGCEDATQLWREIQQQGFPNSKRQVLKWMRERRRVPAPTTPGIFREAIRTERETATKQTAAKPITIPPLPGPKQLAWLFLQNVRTLQPEEAEVLKRVRQDTEAATMFELAGTFLSLVRERQAEQLDPWLAACEKGSIKALHTFAAGLKQDYAAVRAALTLPWSNGPTEGKVNKLKLLKRQMYGRANFDLLRQRVLMAR